MNKNILTESGFALNFFKDISQFETFMQESNKNNYLEYKSVKRYSVKELREFIASFVDIDTLNTLEIRF